MKIGSEPEILIQSVESIPTKTTNRKKRAKEKRKEISPESSDEHHAAFEPSKESVKSKSAILNDALESTQKRKKKKKKDKNAIQGGCNTSFFTSHFSRLNHIKHHFVIVTRVVGYNSD